MPRRAPATCGLSAKRACSTASSSTTHQRHGQHAGQRRQGAAQAEVAPADHQRQVDHVRARHDLRHGPVLDEFVLGQPALALDQFALDDGQHAAEALQGQQREGDEQVGQGKHLIGLYIGKSSVASGYGAAGSLVVVLVWVYYSAQIFLLGAEFTWVYARRYGSMKNLPGVDAAPATPTRDDA
jgi:hypothetical protein